ncbi:unnamed protein product, partial [Rotaria sp. Silwood1]
SQSIHPLRTIANNASFETDIRKFIASNSSSLSLNSLNYQIKH